MTGALETARRPGLIPETISGSRTGACLKPAQWQCVACASLWKVTVTKYSGFPFRLLASSTITEIGPMALDRYIVQYDVCGAGNFARSRPSAGPAA